MWDNPNRVGENQNTIAWCGKIFKNIKAEIKKQTQTPKKNSKFSLMEILRLTAVLRANHRPAR